MTGGLNSKVTLWKALVCGLGIMLWTAFVVTSMAHSQNSHDIEDDLRFKLNSGAPKAPAVMDPRLGNEDNVRMPRHGYQGPVQSDADRLRFLELKLNAYLNAAKDPWFGTTNTAYCNNASNLSELFCKPGDIGYDESLVGKDSNCAGNYDHRICLDGWDGDRPDGKKRIIYDFGLRQQPHFGHAFAEVFGAEVHGFDPSPVSKRFMPTSDANKLPNYHYHDYGAGGVDGDVTLFEYNWEQVSMLRLPGNKLDCSPDAGTELECGKISRPHQGSFTLPVRTLGSVMKELGHDHMDILKVDVEGSEWGFLYAMLDNGCPDFLDQLTLEWHHLSVDQRYGEGSDRDLNTIVTMLHACGLKLFTSLDVAGFTSTSRLLADMEAPTRVRYNIMSFMRE